MDESGRLLSGCGGKRSHPGFESRSLRHFPIHAGICCYGVCAGKGSPAVGGLAFRRDPAEGVEIPQNARESRSLRHFSSIASRRQIRIVKLAVQPTP